MEGEDGLARDPNKKLAHDNRRARQREKKRGMVLPARREKRRDAGFNPPYCLAKHGYRRKILRTWQRFCYKSLKREVAI